MSKKKHTWRGFTFEDEVEEFMFLYTMALQRIPISIDERDRLMELSKKHAKDYKQETKP